MLKSLSMHIVITRVTAPKINLHKDIAQKTNK